MSLKTIPFFGKSGTSRTPARVFGLRRNSPGDASGRTFQVNATRAAPENIPEKKDCRKLSF